MSSVRVFPAGLPTALADGHGFQPMANGRRRARDQGEMRSRPRWRSTPEHCTARWRLTQAQFDAFEAWYEDALRAGSLDFDVLVQRRGQVSGTASGVTWYTAQIVGEYASDVDKTQRYVVSAQLRLLEELGPVRIPPGIEATISLDYALTAQTVPPTFAATIELDFGMSAEMALPPPGVTIEMAFDLAWTAPLPPSASQPRETDAADARETDAGTSRETE